MSPLREFVVFLSGFLTCFVLVLRAQWDTKGEPLMQWNYAAARSFPPLNVRRWFVRISPLLVVLGTGAILAAIFVMR